METTSRERADTPRWEASQRVRRAPAKTRRRGRPRLTPRGRKLAIGATIGAVAVLGSVAVLREAAPPPLPKDVRGTPAWAREHYGRPDSPAFRSRHITTIDFLGRAMFVHEKAAPHFLRLERLFEARAPEYAAAVALGEVDDWSYANRAIRGERSRKSNHAFGLAIDVNALTNVLGTTGDMPEDVVRQWEIEGASGATTGRVPTPCTSRPT